MKNGIKVIDGHVHTFSSEDVSAKIIGSFNKIYSIEFENPGTGTITDVLANMKETGIDYTVMANFAPPKILDMNNQWTIQMSHKYRELVPLVSFHPEMDGNLRAHLEGYIRSGAKGIKIHPMAQAFEPGHSRLDEVYSCCGEIAFPVVFHVGRVANARLNGYADISMIRPVVEKYPDVPFVLTHMADGSVNDVLEISQAYGNVFFDTSIVITGFPPIMGTNEPSWLDDGTVLDVVNSVGAKRLVFGSDYPWGSPKHDMDRFFNMNLSDEQRKLIMGENAAKLFKID